MQHRRLRRKLGVTSKHRKALLQNLVRSLVIHKRIRTTLPKAKEASAFADRMVQLAKKSTLHARRQLIAKMGCPDTADALLRIIAPDFKERQGGYTRVLRLPPRQNDGANMAILEFTETITAPEKETKTKRKKKVKQKKEQAQGTPSEKKQTAEKEVEKAKLEKEKQEKKESEKKGGFLGALRKFLKGDE